MKKGTIVLTRFPFTDLSSAKRRPAVIISKADDKKQDVIVAFISSVIPYKLGETDYVFKTSDKEFNLTGLRKDSVFKMDKLATLEKAIFSGELGSIPDSIIRILEGKVLIALDIKEKQK